ncbi:hypothetical protein NMY22_g7254 [Coprinellus aureogranulatus]|nr:hypothetical protein NMY22_g7254 [Coprinellus aureogranulatus]
MNVYSDDQHRGIELIAGHIESLPQMTIMTRDFNCHSSEWDPAVQHHQTTPILLVDTAARLGLEYAPPSNPGPTFVSRANPNGRSVIDLMFLPPRDVIASAPERATNLQHLGHMSWLTLSRTQLLKLSDLMSGQLELSPCQLSCTWPSSAFCSSALKKAEQ